MASRTMTVILAGKAAGAIKSLDDTEGRLQRFSKRAKKFAKAAALGIAGIGVAIGALAIKAGKDFLATGDSLHKMSERTGQSVEHLSAMNFVMEQNGASLEQYEKGVQTFTKGLLDMQQRGTGPVSDAFKTMGLSMEDIFKLNPEERFVFLAQKLSEVESETQRSALAQQLFGRQGKELLPTINAGAEGIAKLVAQAQASGNVMSTEAAQGAAKFNDAINLAKNRISGLILQGFNKLLPLLSRTADWLNDNLVPILQQHVVPLLVKVKEGFVAVVGGVRDAIRWLTELDPRWLKVIGTVIAAVAAIKAAILVIGLLKTAYVAAMLAIKIATATNPIGLILVALTTLGALAYQFRDEWIPVLKKGFKAFVELAKKGANEVIGAAEGIGNAFISGLNAIIRAWNNFSISTPALKVLGRTVIPSVNWDTPDLPLLKPVKLPRLAEGGIVQRPTVAMIGEAGPEAVVPLGRGGRGAMGNTYNITVYALDTQSAADGVYGAIQELEETGRTEMRVTAG